MIKVTVEGGADVASVLRALQQQLTPEEQATVLLAAAQPIASRMGELAPLGTGAVHIRSEIGIEVSAGEADGDAVIAVGPSRRAFYATFQEFGTSRHPAQPFARPAFNEAWPESLEIVAAKTWQLIERHGK